MRPGFLFQDSFPSADGHRLAVISRPFVFIQNVSAAVFPLAISRHLSVSHRLLLLNQALPVFSGREGIFLIAVSYSGFVPSSIWMTAICPDMLTNASGTQKRSLNLRIRSWGSSAKSSSPNPQMKKFPLMGCSSSGMYLLNDFSVNSPLSSVTRAARSSHGYVAVMQSQSRMR